MQNGGRLVNPGMNPDIWMTPPGRGDDQGQRDQEQAQAGQHATRRRGKLATPVPPASYSELFLTLPSSQISMRSMAHHLSDITLR